MTTAKLQLHWGSRHYISSSFSVLLGHIQFKAAWSGNLLSDKVQSGNGSPSFLSTFINGPALQSWNPPSTSDSRKKRFNVNGRAATGTQATSFKITSIRKSVHCVHPHSGLVPSTEPDSIAWLDRGLQYAYIQTQMQLTQ